MTKKKTVLFSGTPTTQSGYGHHSRDVAKYLLSKEKEYNLDLTFDPVMWGNCGWILDRNYDDGVVGKIMDRTGNRKQFYDVSISLKLPNEWTVNKNALTKIGITAGVETTKCNPSWINDINSMDEVIVPSNFTKETFLNSGQVRTNISVVGESFSNDLLNNDNKELDLELTTDFNFLLLGQITGNNPENDRKNLFYSIKWLCETFHNDKNVGIIVKTNMSRNSILDKYATKNLMTKLLTEVRRNNPYPKFYLLHGNMSHKEIGSLLKHTKVKGMVNASKGEGFSIPTLEAGVCELPVIATNWSAHTEFLNLGKFTKLDYSLKPIHPSRIDNQIFMEGSQWADVHELDFKNKVKDFKLNYSEKLQWAKELSPKLKEKYSITSIINSYDEILKKYLK